MFYQEYDRIKQGYKRTKAMYDSLADKRDIIFTRTQPGAVRLDKVRIQSTRHISIMENYVIDLEASGIDERMREVRTILSDRKLLLDLAENDLIASHDLYDIVYYHHFVKRRTIVWIAAMTGYCQRQINRIISAIKKALSEGQCLADCEQSRQVPKCNSLLITDMLNNTED